MKTLTSEPAADLSRIRTQHDLVGALRALRLRRSLTFDAIAKRSKARADHPEVHELKRATVSDALNGKTTIALPLLRSLLVVLDEPDNRRREWVAAWERVMLNNPPEAGRFETAAPRDLGIHGAITTPDASGELPTYVARDFDFKLRTVLSSDLPSRGNFVVLIGRSSTGKTRSLYEAVLALMPHWWLVQPSDTQELLDLRSAPPRQTVFWLDEMQRYLGSHPPLTWECVRMFVRHGNIVVGTLWPDQVTNYTTPRPSGRDDDISRLLRAAVQISVPDRLTDKELREADRIADEDSRIRVALDTSDVGLTQALAGGPALVMRWEQPPNTYTGAMIESAADAHRLGVQSPLNEDLLAEAMFGYLDAADRVEPKEVWLAQALPNATERLNGNVSALSPVDDGRPGTTAGYTVADYLAQHLRQHRRAAHVPDSAWRALISRVRSSADLRRLADSASARLRYCYAELALERLASEFGDGTAAIELAELLVRQDRFERAVEVLNRHLAANPRDRSAGRHLSRTHELWQRVEEIRPAADACDPAARERIVEILIDGGICDDLRARADSGDLLAAEQLVERLVERGCRLELTELADRGNEFAAEALADLYAAWGEVDLLQARANAGDQAAELRLSKVRPTDPDSAVQEVTALRAGADAGRPEDALQLCTRLFELRDEHQLWLEMQAGTRGAAERLIALYTAEGNVPPERLVRLRSFGLDANGDEYVLVAPPALTPNRRDL